MFLPPAGKAPSQRLVNQTGVQKLVTELASPGISLWVCYDDVIQCREIIGKDGFGVKPPDHWYRCLACDDGAAYVHQGAAFGVGRSGLFIYPSSVATREECDCWLTKSKVL